MAFPVSPLHWILFCLLFAAAIILYLGNGMWFKTWEWHCMWYYHKANENGNFILSYKPGSMVLLHGSNGKACIVCACDILWILGARNSSIQLIQVPFLKSWTNRVRCLFEQSWMLVCILFFIVACLHSFLYWGAFFFLKERADTVVTGLTFNPCYLEDIYYFKGCQLPFHKATLVHFL